MSAAPRLRFLKPIRCRASVNPSEQGTDSAGEASRAEGLCERQWRASRDRTSVVAGFGTLSRTLRTRWLQRALVAGRGEDLTERCPQPELCCATQCVPVDARSEE